MSRDYRDGRRLSCSLLGCHPFLQERATSCRQGTPWKINMQPANHLFETENRLNHPPSFFSFHSIKIFRVPAPGWWLTYPDFWHTAFCGTSRLLAPAPYTTRRTCIAILPVHGNPTTRAPGGWAPGFMVGDFFDITLTRHIKALLLGMMVGVGCFWFNLLNKDLYY